MNPSTFLDLIVRPTLRWMGPRFASERAEGMIVAIALQESGLFHRAQIGGPARGFTQFEEGNERNKGGVWALFRHPATRDHILRACNELRIPMNHTDVYHAIEWNDQMAVVCARLLLWSDPLPLPDLNDDKWAWNAYQRTFRPGHPRPMEWPENLRLARLAIDPPVYEDEESP